MDKVRLSDAAIVTVEVAAAVIVAALAFLSATIGIAVLCWVVFQWWSDA